MVIILIADSFVPTPATAIHTPRMYLDCCRIALVHAWTNGKMQLAIIVQLVTIKLRAIDAMLVMVVIRIVNHCAPTKQIAAIIQSQ